MSIFTYECRKCGYKFDVLEKYEVHELPYSAPPTDKKCDGMARRIPAAASFRFNCSMPTYQRPKT